MSFFVPKLGQILTPLKQPIKMTIEKHATNNVGGICKLFYFYISDLINLKPIANQKVEIEIRSLAQFHQIKFTHDTAFIEEELKKDKDGKYTELKLKAFLPGATEDLIQELTPMLTSRIGIIYQLNSGEWKTAGTKQEPIQILTSFETGSKFTDLKGVTIETTRQFISPIPYTNPVT